MSFRSIDLLNLRTWQSAECRFRRTLVVVHHTLLFRKLACGQTTFRGHSGDCALHEQIVILFPYCKVLSKEQRSRLKECCIENAEPVLSSGRHSLDRRLFVAQLPQDTHATSNPDNPG
jgi:hypothetical protein